MPRNRIITVKPRGLLFEPTDVLLGDDGTVELEGVKIGRVEKSTRTYSPPIRRGSPIARYHKTVACWRIDGDRGMNGMTYDTRNEAIVRLIIRHRRGD